MPSLLKSSSKKTFAQTFLDDIKLNKNKYFFFIGKSTSWTDENIPDPYVDTIENEFKLMNGIIAYKQITPSDVFYALKKNIWTTGIIYDQYTDKINLFEEDDASLFYVITSQNHIFKCLGNNNNSISVIEPNQTVSFSFTLSDGYVWKYLASVEETNFPIELSDYVPVQFADIRKDLQFSNQYNTQLESIPGEISSVVPFSIEPASGVYTNTIQVPADGSRSYALRMFSFTKNEITGVKKIRIIDPISLNAIRLLTVDSFIGYMIRVDSSTLNPSEIGNYAIITGKEDNTADGWIEFTVVDDLYEFVVSGYNPNESNDIISLEILPYIKIYGNGEGAILQPVLNSAKQIVQVSLINRGKNYTNVLANVVTVPKTETVSPTLNFILSPKNGHGSNILQELNVKDVVLSFDIDEDDADVFVENGKYRQFGIIKNPILFDESTKTKKDNIITRDIILAYDATSPVNGLLNITTFLTNIIDQPDVLIIGKESNSCAKIVKIKDINNSEGRVTLQIVDSTSGFISESERPNNFYVTVSDNSSFVIGERVKQTIPAGNILSGVTLGFSLESIGYIIDKVDETILVIKVEQNLFAINYSIFGDNGYFSTVLSVSPQYGERIDITNREVFYDTTRFAIVEISNPYVDLKNVSKYSGLHRLHISTSSGTNGVTGANSVDITDTPLLSSSFIENETIIQGTTSDYSKGYGSGVVYSWEFINSSRGIIYLTNVVGDFKSVETHTPLESKLGNFVISSISKPDILSTSGELLYIDNMRPITRLSGQNEEFRVRLEF